MRKNSLLGQSWREWEYHVWTDRLGEFVWRPKICKKDVKIKDQVFLNSTTHFFKLWRKG